MNTKFLPQNWGLLLLSFLLCLPALVSAQDCSIDPNPNIKSATCFGGSDGRILLEPSGGTPPYAFQWSTGSTREIIAGLTTGNYAFTITDAEACSISGSYFVGQNAKILGNIGKVDVECHGDATGLAALSPSGGVRPYSYQWSTGDTTRFVTGLSAGPISYTITDFRGCTGTGAISIFEPAPVWTTFEQRYACYGEENGTAEIFANGGTPPYTYLWSTGETTSRITGLGEGMYGYTVTDSRGCQSAAGLVCIFFSPEPDAIDITAGPPVCGDEASGTASVTVVGGYGPFTYDWSNGDTGAAISGLTAGAYEVTVTDAGGCTYTASTTIMGGDNVTVSVTELPNGNLRATPSGGTAPYTYAWSNGETVQTANDYEAGSPYSVTVTDANGCTASASGITPGDPNDCPGNVDFPGRIGNDQSLCAPGNVPERLIELEPATGGNGPIEYVWMFSSTSGTWNPDFYQPLPNSNSPSYQPGPLDVTTHFVRCVRVEGCVYLESNAVTVTVGDELNPTIMRPDRGCFGETSVFSVDNAPGSISWSFNGPVTTNTTFGRRVEVTFVGAGPLSFSVTLSTDDCTGTFSDQMMIASCATGPGQGGESANLVSINPNPVQELTMLEFGTELRTPATVNVYNMNQAQIATYPVAAYTRRMELSLAEQPAGVYLVQILQDGQPLRTLRLIKQ